MDVSHGTGNVRSNGDTPTPRQDFGGVFEVFSQITTAHKLGDQVEKTARINRHTDELHDARMSNTLEDRHFSFDEQFFFHRVGFLKLFDSHFRSKVMSFENCSESSLPDPITELKIIEIDIVIESGYCLFPARHWN